MKIDRLDILGVPVDVVNMSQAVDFVDHIIKTNDKAEIIAVNPEKVIKANSDSVLKARLISAKLLIADGIGVVLAARILRNVKMERVPGSELMPEICNLSMKKGYKIFLYGAKSEVVHRAADVLRSRYWGLNIVGIQDGYLAESDETKLINEINISGAHILFLALGSPKQEMWIDKNMSRLNINICQGVGGTFDVIAGNVRRAPLFFRRIHLEWFYRLISNPKRLFRQTALPVFVFSLLKEKLLK